MFVFYRSLSIILELINERLQYSYKEIGTMSNEDPGSPGSVIEHQLFSV